MNTFSNRVKNRRKELGLSQDALAKKAGLSQTTISDIERGRNDGSREILPLAKALQCSPEHLLEGKPIDTPNTSPGPDIRGKVPLISWVQAGAFCNAVDLFEPGVADDWIPCVQLLGPHAYALRVVGDSMTSAHGLSYPEGIIIFVDPDYPVTNGCRVIAKLPHADEATFKMYSEDAGARYLKPLNPQYPTITMTPDMQLCGVVRGAYRIE